MDRDTYFFYVNDIACEVLGYSREKLLSMNLKEIDAEFSPKSWALHWKSLKQSGTISMESVYEDKNGDTYPVEVHINYIEFEGQEYGCVFFKDITQKKKIEEDLRRTQRLEAIGLLAGGIAHNFNNQLTAVIGNLSLAKTITPQNGELFHCLVNAENASFRAKEVAGQLLTFSTGGMPVKQAIAIPELVQQVVDFTLSGSNCTYEVEQDGDIPLISADGSQISQVLQNLIINADQAMPDGGRILTRIKKVNFDNDQFRPLSTGDYVNISVVDHGVGIAEKHVAIIFDPFFSTKEMGRGLGLATAYSIIKNHDGHITVQLEPGKNTTFDIYLPIPEESIGLIRKEEIPLKGNGKILVMDDEVYVRETLSRMLGNLGYAVETARDGTEAVEIYGAAIRSQDFFDAVILDLTVPGGMGGKETLAKLLEIDPKIKAIVSSGYSNDEVISRYKEYGFSGVLKKPCTLTPLSEVLKTTI